ncbi:spherulation-specific family 4 protein, partial [Candidatus Nitrosotenuis cloacae]|uniref:spherulation-specific family 4 protein n=1 Tax=Candidatus Nitrosotenuis cloacae TaxID=1603555 RepID=UPI002280E5BB
MLVTATLVTSQPAYSAASAGIMIPLYTYPGGTWDQVIAAKAAHPSVPIIAIINPNNGPGSSRDANYASGIQELQSAGIVVIGYVFTQYGSRSTSAVTADIDRYKSFYPQIQGIFFDEMLNTLGGENYYLNLSNYAKSSGFSFTVGNPGTDIISSYVGTMDNIIIYETGGLPSLNTLGGWHTGYDKSNFSYLAYGVGTLDTDFVASSTNYVSYMYITNDSLSNPWDSVTPYFTDLAAALDDGTAPPPEPTNSVTVQSADLSGSAITGMWTEIMAGGSMISSGYTPLA